MPQLDCQTAIILSLLLSLSIVHCSTVDTSRDAEKEWLNWDNFLGEDDFALYHPPIPEMKGLSCFQCSPKDHHMNCDLIRDPSSFEDFLEHNPDFLEEMKMAKKVDGTWTWENSMAQKFHEAEHPNPCKLITNKVLELVESSEDAIPIYLDAGKDSKTRYDSLKDAISTIQFQRRGTSDWVAVEVQLRDKEGLFSFILPDLEPGFLDIPEDSIFYTSL